MASASYTHPHGDLRDDESILDDDVIEADDGVFLTGPSDGVVPLVDCG